MKKFIPIYILFIMTVQFCNAQTDSSQNEIDTYKALAKEKGTILQTQLSLSDEQTEHVVKKIFKYSIKAKDVLQSDLGVNDKTKQLYAIAAEQKEEIRTILSKSQYDYYKRRDGAISISR